MSVTEPADPPQSAEQPRQSADRHRVPKARHREATAPEQPVHRHTESLQLQAARHRQVKQGEALQPQTAAAVRHHMTEILLMTGVHHTPEAHHMIIVVAVHHPAAASVEVLDLFHPEVLRAEVIAEEEVHQADTEDNRTT